MAALRGNRDLGLSKERYSNLLFGAPHNTTASVSAAPAEHEPELVRDIVLTYYRDPRTLLRHIADHAIAWWRVVTDIYQRPLLFRSKQ